MPQAYQPFLEAFKHSKNKRGSVAAQSRVLTELGSFVLSEDGTSKVLTEA